MYSARAYRPLSCPALRIGLYVQSYKSEVHCERRQNTKYMISLNIRHGNSNGGFQADAERAVRDEYSVDSREPPNLIGFTCGLAFPVM